MIMERELALARLRARADELKAAGIASLSVFGSTARGEANPGSDVDIVIRFSEDFRARGFAYFGALDALQERLSSIVGAPVDLVAEPVRKPRLAEDIEADRIIAF